jgi:hypothetical protein
VFAQPLFADTLIARRVWDALQAPAVIRMVAVCARAAGVPRAQRRLPPSGASWAHSGRSPAHGRAGVSWALVRRGLLTALGVLALAGCGGERAPTHRSSSPSSTAPGSNLVAVAIPVPVRSVKAGAASGMLQLQAVGLGRSSRWGMLATLVNPVAREPDDVCFGVYTASEDPAAGDVLCGVRGHGRLVSVLGESSIPGAGALRQLSYLVGQAPPGVTRLELVGLEGSHTLRLSAARMFLATFTPAARGRVELRATLSDGRNLTSPFTLPLSSAQMQAFSDRYRRPGAVFNGEIDENLVGTPYHQIVKRFGQPLATLSNSHRERCVYYDLVGYDTGWSFCFKHGMMTSAGGNQIPPPGVT